MRAHRLRPVAGEAPRVVSICQSAPSEPQIQMRSTASPAALRGPTDVEPVATRQRAVSARSRRADNRLSEAAAASVRPLPVGRDDSVVGWAGLKSRAPLCRVAHLPQLRGLADVSMETG